MDTSKQETTKRDEVKELVFERLIGYFSNKKVSYEMAKLAQGTLTAVSRLEATERVKDATQYMVVKSLAKNPNELRKYIGLTLPHLTPVRLLDRPKK